MTVIHFYSLSPDGIFGPETGDIACWPRSMRFDCRADLLRWSEPLHLTRCATPWASVAACAARPLAVWTLFDLTADSVFEAAHLLIEDGPAAGHYTLAEHPLVAGGRYETVGVATGAAHAAHLLDGFEYDAGAFAELTGTIGVDPEALSDQAFRDVESAQRSPLPRRDRA